MKSFDIRGRGIETVNPSASSSPSPTLAGPAWSPLAGPAWSPLAGPAWSPLAGPAWSAVFHALVEQLERAYSLKVTIGPVTGSYTGQFDGKEIWVDLDKDPEEAVFILVHLFGHTVQWNVDEKLRVLGLANSGVTEADLPRIYQYEREASRLGLALLEQTGEFRLARWLTDRFGADWKFLAHFYRTGEKVRFEVETGADEPLLTSIPIPSFVPQRWPPRGSF